MSNKATLRKIIIGQLATLTGDKFQDFCDRFCLKLHPNDYQPVRAGGRPGDEKNDGYCPEARIFYAAFGSRNQKLVVIKSKIKKDLLGCLKKQVEVREWCFLTNDDKLPGNIEKYLDQEFRRSKKFQKKYPKLKIKASGAILIANVLLTKFSEAEIFEILDMGSPSSDAATVGQLSEINETTKRIEKLIEARAKSVDLESSTASLNATISQAKPVVDAQENDVAQSKYKAELESAKSLLDQEEFKASRKIYEKLLMNFESDDTIPQLIRFKAHNNLGACLASIGENKGAVLHFKKAYELIGMSSIIACKNRALASSLEGKPGEGLSYINAAIELNPDDNGCIHIKAMLLREAGKPEEALKLYQE